MKIDQVGIEQGLGVKVVGARRQSGGDICQAWRLETETGPVFLKQHNRPPPGFFAAEQAGLEALGISREGPRVPEVKGLHENWIALEWLEPGRAADDDRTLGEQLAALHRLTGEHHGGAEDNYIGTLAQRNRLRASWVDCWREDRLRPQMLMARQALGPGRSAACERLLDRLDGLLPDHPEPSQLHGDLWRGNWMHTATGPALFDPSAYRGHREVDLAMLALFGGFPARAAEAYQASWALDPGVEERRPIYQLYPLLVHVNLFGGGYVAQVESVVRRYV